MSTSWLRALGSGIGRHPVVCLLAWVCLIGAAAPFAARLETLLSDGAGMLPHTRSFEAARRLEAEFDSPYRRLLVVTFHAAHPLVPDRQEAITRQCALVLERQPGVVRVASGPELRDPRLRSADGRDFAMLVGLDATSTRAEEALVPVVRQALAPFDRPELRVRVTGPAAISVDIAAFNARELNRAEGRALPLTLGLLLLTFGSLLAAGTPLAVGLVATVTAMGALYGIAQLTELSVLAQSIVSMLGLALGIDYALVMVSRFRAGLQAGLAPRDAVAEAMGTAGGAVAFSALTVLVGFAGLFFSPVLETRAVGLGGVLVVAGAAAAALTLLPALLVLVGARLDWPRALARASARGQSPRGWRRFAAGVVARPRRALAVSAAILLLMSLPSAWFVPGFPDRKWLPPALESREGMDVLDRLGLGWSVMPIDLIVSATDDRPILGPGHLASLLALSKALHEDPRVELVQGPVDLRPGLGPAAYALFYAHPQRTLDAYPELERLYLARDGRSALMQVVLKNHVSLRDAIAFVGELQATAPPGSERLLVGGQLAYYRDLDEVMAASTPWSVGFVLVSTYLILFLAFRSYLLPLKAILLNLLSVGAGIGAMVAVFLLGWGTALVGLPEPVDAIPRSLVLIVFCVVFGLSMDYEVFLLARIKERFERHGDNRRAIVEGLTDTGGLITSAAAIMIVVFAAFVAAAVPVVKMVGFGLAVAVLADATLVRCLAAPAFMRLAGRWNWYPGRRAGADTGDQAAER